LLRQPRAVSALYYDRHVPSASDSIGVTDGVSFSLDRPDDKRPWIEMWEIVKHNRRLVDAAYADVATRRDAETHLKTAVMNFCVCCAHLIDHLGWDPAVAGNTGTQQSVDKIRDELTNNYQPLDLVLDACNTYKHHTRIKKNSKNVRIRKFSSPPPRIAFGWEDAVGKANYRDALDVVNDAMAAWERYLAHERLI